MMGLYRNSISHTSCVYRRSKIYLFVYVDRAVEDLRAVLRSVNEDLEFIQAGMYVLHV